MDKAKDSQHISITHEFIILPCVCCYGHLFPPSSPEVITTTFDFASTYSNICCDYTYTLFLTEKHMYVWWPGLIVNSANIESPEKSIRIEDWLACGWLVGMIVRNYFLPWVKPGMNIYSMVCWYRFQGLGPGLFKIRERDLSTTHTHIHLLLLLMCFKFMLLGLHHNNWL